MSAQAKQTMKQKLELIFDTMPEDIATSLDLINQAIARVEQMVTMQIVLAQEDASEDKTDEKREMAEKATFDRIEQAIGSLKTAVADLARKPALEAGEKAEMHALTRIEAAIKAIPRQAPTKAKTATLQLEFIPQYDGAGKLRKIIAKEA